MTSGTTRLTTHTHSHTHIQISLCRSTYRNLQLHAQSIWIGSWIRNGIGIAAAAAGSRFLTPPLPSPSPCSSCSCNHTCCKCNQRRLIKSIASPSPHRVLFTRITNVQAICRSFTSYTNTAPSLALPLPLPSIVHSICKSIVTTTTNSTKSWARKKEPGL